VPLSSYHGVCVCMCAAELRLYVCVRCMLCISCVRTHMLRKEPERRRCSKMWLIPEYTIAGVILLRHTHTNKILQKPRTQNYMDLRYIDPQATVLNYCFK